MAKILVLHGPNLNLLGKREPLHYGFQSLDQLNAKIIEHGKQLGHEVECCQSNAEGQLIDKIHQAPEEKINFIIFNPAGFTHTSIALRDALLGINIPFIEVHLSNIYKREPFRHYSYFSDISEGVITGLGDKGYFLALEAVHSYLSDHGVK
jgi:3-dehydroquinate dehydratase-2